MKYAYLTSQYPAVSHTFIRREIEALRGRGFQIETFSITKPGDLLTETDRAECDRTWYVLPVPAGRLLAAHVRILARHPRAYVRTLLRAMRLRTRGLKGLLKWSAYFAEAVVLARELQRRRTDQLHNHFANASANVAMLAAELLGIPWTVTLHGIAELEWDGVGSLSAKAASAKHVVCVCDFNRAQAMRMTDFSDWPKLHVVRCGLNFEGFPPIAREQNNGRRLRILCVARLSREKGLPGLIDAFHRARRAGLDAELRMVGEGPQREVIEREIRRLGLGEDCRLLGAMAGADLLREYHGADMLVMASLAEGLPMVLMEAMATGVAVIAPRLAGIPELVVHAQTGLLYTPGRWDQLAEAMVRLGSDSLLRRRLVAAGRDRVAEMHDIRKSIEPLAELLRSRVNGQSTNSQS